MRRDSAFLLKPRGRKRVSCLIISCGIHVLYFFFVHLKSLQLGHESSDFPLAEVVREGGEFG